MLLLLKLPFGFGNLPMLVPELEWLLVGQKMSEGSRIYQEVWTFTSPVVSIIYDIIYTFGGRAMINYHIAALILVFIQALYFNYLCGARRLFLEKSYVPALIYVVLMSISFDFQKISPPLISTTFVLLSLNGLLKQVESSQTNNNYSFEIGLFISLAILSHFPTVLLIAWAVFAVLVYSNYSFRQFLLFVLGLAIPFLAFVIYYSFVGSFNDFLVQWVSSVFQIKGFALSNLFNSLLVFMLPILLLVVGVFRVFTNIRYSSYQNRSHQVILFLGIFTFAATVLADNSATYQFALIVPVFAFFITAFFLHVKGTLLPELVFLLFISVAVILQKTGYSKILGVGYEHLSSIRVNDNKYQDLKGKRILVTGFDNSPYKNTVLATKYLNWSLSQSDLENPSRYESVVSIYDSFKNDPPEYIVDNEGVFPEIFRIIPELKKQYVLERESLYKRKD